MNTTERAAALTEPKMRGLVIESLDAWRGFAALWVVMVHAVVPTMLTKFPGLAGSALYRLPLLGALGVPIFFVISGFCIANAADVLVPRADGRIKFVQARFKRLYPPYIIMSAIAFVASILAGIAVHKHIIPSSYLAGFDPLHAPFVYWFAAVTLTQMPLGQTPILAPFWSLSYEAAFYVVVLAGLVVASRVAKLRLVTVLHVVTALAIVLYIVNPALAIFPLDHWPQFGVGVLLYDLLRNPHERRAQITALVLGAGVAIAAIAHPTLGYGGIDKPPISVQLATSLLTGLIIWGTYRYDREILKFAPVRWLASVGVFSYSLYLSHFLILGIVLQLFKHVHYTEHTFIVVFVAQVVISVAGGWAFYRLCESRFISKKAKRIHEEATSRARPLEILPVAG